MNQDSQLSGQKTGSFKATAKRWLDEEASDWLALSAVKVGSPGITTLKYNTVELVFAYCKSL